MAIRSFDSLFDSTRPSWRIATTVATLVVLGGLIHLVVDQKKVAIQVPEPPNAHLAERVEIPKDALVTAMMHEP